MEPPGRETRVEGVERPLGAAHRINEMDPPLCGSTSMSHNDFKIGETIEPQEASPVKQNMALPDLVWWYTANLVGMVANLPSCCA